MEKRTDLRHFVAQSLTTCLPVNPLTRVETNLFTYLCVMLRVLLFCLLPVISLFCVSLFLLFLFVVLLLFMSKKLDGKPG